MAKVVIPSREELERYAEADPLIHPAEVLAMLRVLRAGEEIQSAILDGSLRRHGISSGKFTVLIILYQRKEDLAPSELARLAGVTRATISMMLARMKRDGLITEEADAQDGRQKHIRLTEAGLALMEEILPAHYQRVSALMGRLTESEQEELIRLLGKFTG